VWAGVDSAWEQRKLEASLPWRAVQGKMLENGDESHLPKRSEGVHALLGGRRNGQILPLVEA